MTRYHVQLTGMVSELSEDELVQRLRGGLLSGLELVRVDGEEEWRPLHELPVYREAVPHVGDSGDAARRSVAKAFGWHLLFYVIITGWLLGASVPAAIWGFFVALHAVRALPATWTLVRKGTLLGPGRATAALPAAHEAPRTPAAALPKPSADDTRSAAALPAGSDAEAMIADVRSLLARRSSDEATDRLEGVAAALGELRSRKARLSALLGTEDRGALEQRLAAAEAALDEASEPADETLRRRAVEVLHESLAANERARRTLERLGLRESLAMEQLQQLRLELARLEADAPGPEDLGERLDQIRIETEASAEADALVAGRS